MQSIKTSIFLVLTFTSMLAKAQSSHLKFGRDIVLPNDSAERSLLVNSIASFLQEAQKTRNENKFVFEKEKIETFIQLDEAFGIENSKEFKNEHFYKPYLTNLIFTNDSSYLVQVSYLGVIDSLASLRASFEFVAHKKGGGYLFSSPLLRNTKNWKVTKIGNNIFHYQDSLDRNKAEEYTALVHLYDTKLGVPAKTTDYYLSENTVSMNKLIGVDYKADYNGKSESSCVADLSDRRLVLYGNNNPTFSHFDPHDLFHERLSLVISRNKVNKRVDEGCAYLYGGSLGFTWKEIFIAFKEQVANNKELDWVELKENNVHFKTGSYGQSADVVVNALLIKKIEKDKGFAGVWELLLSGPFEKGNDKYYNVLEKLTGITKQNYNEKIWELIDNENL